MNYQPAEFIGPEETIDLRTRILRPGQNIQLCHYPEDAHQSTFHLGIKLNGAVVSNGTFIQQSHPTFFVQSKKPYRLRGMATDPKHQRKGLGQLIIYAAFSELKNRKSDLLWFNARTSAEEFYKKLGFLTIGHQFDLSLIGPHKVMYIDFKNR